MAFCPHGDHPNECQEERVCVYLARGGAAHCRGQLAGLLLNHKKPLQASEDSPWAKRSSQTGGIRVGGGGPMSVRTCGGAQM